MPDWPKDLTSSMISSLSLFSDASSTAPNENICTGTSSLQYGDTWYYEALMTWRK
jgi:hypothetical protein